MKEYTIKESKSNRKDNLEVTLSCVAFLIIWQVLALVINNDIYIPTIGQTLNSLKEIISSEAYRTDYENITSALLFKPLDYETAITVLDKVVQENIF